MKKFFVFLKGLFRAIFPGKKSPLVDPPGVKRVKTELYYEETEIGSC